MRFNYKKVSAIVASALMTGMTMGVAAAAAFPTDFTAESPGIVYGASADAMDATQATAINDYLSPKVPITGNLSGGESVKLEASSTKFQLGYGAYTVASTGAITNTDPNGGLPVLLADGTYEDSANDEFDYTQKIELANFTLTMFDDNDYKQDTPTVGVRIAGGAHIASYNLTFTDKPCWSKLATTDLKLMGKTYYVLSITNGTTLNLLDSSSGTITLAEGETKTVTVGGKTYEVGLNFIGSSTVKLDVNGVTTNTLSKAETQRLSDGAYVGIKEINTQDYAGGTKTVEFAIGTGKLKILSGSSVELNDNAITELTATLTSAGSSSCTTYLTTLSKIGIEWKADDDTFIATDSSPEMPGFKAIKFAFTGMTFPSEEKIELEPSSTTVSLKNFPLKTSTENIEILYQNNATSYYWGNYTATGIGKEAGSNLHTTNNSNFIWNSSSQDAQFIASWTDGTAGESYLMKVTDFALDATSTGADHATFYYKKDGVWTEAKKEALAGDTVTVGNVQLVVASGAGVTGAINRTLKTINITAGGSTVFNTLYSKNGMKIYLPYGDTPSTTYSNTTKVGKLHTGSSSSTFNLTFSEEDKNSNLGSGANVTASIGFNSASTPEPSVETLIYANGRGVKSGSDAEIGDTDVFRNFLYSDLGTEILWNKVSTGQKSLKLNYHNGESYGSVYVTSPSAVGSAGSMVFKDSEDSWKTKNVIIVGGSCINTAAATALGVSSGTCGAAFTTATSVGSGQFLIQSVKDKFTTGKLALVVAGYNKEDTAAAASRLVNQASTVDTTAGNKYIGTVGVSGTSTIAKVA